MNRQWTDTEWATLRRMYATCRTSEVAKAIGRSERSVYQAAERIGLKKAPDYFKATRDTIIVKAGVSGRFKRGQVPHNKGQKMRPETLEKLRPTLFQKGNKPHTWVPVGTAYTYKRDGLTKVKVSDDMSLPRNARWRFAHHLLWEQHNGPIPEGGIVRFKDGNTSNVTIQNLELIDRKTNAVLNSIHRYPKEVVRTLQAVGALKRIIRNKRKNHGKEQAQ